MPDLPIGYIGLKLGPQDPRGPQKTVARTEFVVITPSLPTSFHES